MPFLYKVGFILGTSTWGAGELQDGWADAVVDGRIDAWVPAIKAALV